MPSHPGSSTSVQDYVKVIYSHAEWSTGPITTTELALRLGVASASASEMVRRMDGMGLVRYRPYRPVELTDAGRALAVAMVRRHRVLETWLATDLGYGWDEVHEEAERLEHAVSDRLIDRIADRLGDPRHDPHGDPIPRPDGSVDPVDASPLAAFDPGHRVRVRRISDADPAVLRRLRDAGITPGATVTIGATDAGGHLLHAQSGRPDRLVTDRPVTDRPVTDRPVTDRPVSRPDGREGVQGPQADVRLEAADVAALWASSDGPHPGCSLAQRHRRET